MRRAITIVVPFLAGVLVCGCRSYPVTAVKETPQVQFEAVGSQSATVDKIEPQRTNRPPRPRQASLTNQQSLTDPINRLVPAESPEPSDSLRVTQVAQVQVQDESELPPLPLGALKGLPLPPPLPKADLDGLGNLADPGLPNHLGPVGKGLGHRLLLSPEREPTELEVKSNGNLISLVAREAPLDDILTLISQQQHLNIVSAETLNRKVSVNLKDVPLDAALESMLTIAGFTWMRQGDILLVTPITDETKLAPNAQGRTIRVYDLNFADATELQRMVEGMLSPVGHVFISEAAIDDLRKTRDRVVVEDLPAYVHRIDELIAQVDRAPQQVLIEAHILQVTLDSNDVHGVDLSEISDLAGTSLSIGTQNFTRVGGDTAGMVVGIDGPHLDGIVELLRSTTDAKTLATPRVMVVDGQQARMQIGSRLGFFVNTIVDNQTIQNVEFIDVGVVLNVVPQITDDGRILMSVHPEVSTGQIDSVTGLPEEETTQLETSVMLPSGRGIVIGGLIQEDDIDVQSKVPVLGDIWGIGTLFRRSLQTRARSELIIALIPRLVPYTDPDVLAVDASRYQQATTPIFDGPLRRVQRPWEPRLPDPLENPRRFDVQRVPDGPRSFRQDRPYKPEHYFPTPDERSPVIVHPVDPTPLPSR